jgi:hypothetical protein
LRDERGSVRGGWTPTSELEGYIDAGDVLVAITGDHVLGHLQLIDGFRPSEIKNTAVEASQRGRTIGSSLIAAVIVRRPGAQPLDRQSRNRRCR